MSAQLDALIAEGAHAKATEAAAQAKIAALKQELADARAQIPQIVADAVAASQAASDAQAAAAAADLKASSDALDAAVATP
jgi:hypothetical protein